VHRQTFDYKWERPQVVQWTSVQVHVVGVPVSGAVDLPYRSTLSVAS
jgi:hypothetical protein